MFVDILDIFNRLNIMRLKNATLTATAKVYSYAINHIEYSEMLFCFFFFQNNIGTHQILFSNLLPISLECISNSKPKRNTIKLSKIILRSAHSLGIEALMAHFVWYVPHSHWIPWEEM